jgi:hypothetical protein
MGLAGIVDGFTVFADKDIPLVIRITSRGKPLDFEYYKWMTYYDDCSSLLCFEWFGPPETLEACGFLDVPRIQPSGGLRKLLLNNMK